MTYMSFFSAWSRSDADLANRQPAGPATSVCAEPPTEGLQLVDCRGSSDSEIGYAG